MRHKKIKKITALHSSLYISCIILSNLAILIDPSAVGFTQAKCAK